MTADEKQKTGVYRLSDKEKTALGQWIEANCPKQSAEGSTQRLPTLLENLMNGHYLRLSDNTLWHIRPEDLAISQGWILAVEITVSPSRNPFFPNTLTNKVTGSSVLARKVDKLPIPGSPALAPKAEEKILTPQPQQTQKQPPQK